MAFPPEPLEIVPPWRTKSTTKRAQRSERKGAKNEGGFTTAMSGAGRQKGDYLSAGWRTEDKTTDAASYRLELDDLRKIEHHALVNPPRAMPKMRVTIQGRTYWVIREEDALALGLGELDGR